MCCSNTPAVDSGHINEAYSSNIITIWQYICAQAEEADKPLFQISEE